MEEAEIGKFIRSFQQLLEVVTAFVSPDEGVPLTKTLEAHFGGDPQRLPVVADRYEPFEHVNVQVAVDALLADVGDSFELVGLLGDQHAFMSFAELVQYGSRRGIGVGAVEHVSLPDGPHSTRLCVQAGLYTLRVDGVPVAVLLRGPNEHGPHQAVSVEVLAGGRELAETVVAAVRRLSVEHSVFRNQVLSFASGPFGEPTAGPVAFHPRPQVTRDEVILPADTSAAIEEHVFGIASHRQQLRASGQHLKRGLLLHGPPGTGKTLTTRYLIGQLVDHTVVVLSGAALGYIGAAATLARSLQPALVVLEDVDLVATERMPEFGHASPLLFELLNVMDGLDEDADLIFVLTTNRADVLEPALAARPGRVDQAVEIQLPDAEARRRLLQLYGHGVDLQLANTESVVGRTAGVTASFIKELIRKAALIAARTATTSTRLTVTDRDINQALDILLKEGAGLTRALLGVAVNTDPNAIPDGVAPTATDWFAYAPLGRSRRPATFGGV